VATRFGTPNFVSFGAAIDYYRDLETCSEEELGELIGEKIAAQEISIGPPELKDGESLGTDSDGRYYVVVQD